MDGLTVATLRYAGRHLPMPGAGSGEVRALEEGAWGRDLLKVSLPQAQSHEITLPSPHAIHPRSLTGGWYADDFDFTGFVAIRARLVTA